MGGWPPQVGKATTEVSPTSPKAPDVMLLLLLLFTVVPLVEFSLLFALGQRIGLFGTIALVIFTGALGATLARWQGMQTLWKLQKGLARGVPPTDVLIDGAMILVAAAVLVTPGILTDAFGFALLTPAFRRVLKPLLRAWFAHRVHRATSFSWSAGGSRENPFPKEQNDNVVEGEILEIRSETPQE